MTYPWDNEPTPRSESAVSEWIYVEGMDIEIADAKVCRALEKRLRAAEKLLVDLIPITDFGFAQEIKKHLVAARQEDETR